MTAARKPHVHAKEIHAFADGLDIQSFDSACGWYDDSHPGFFADRQYRIKPERVYPLTLMTHDEIWSEVRKAVPCSFSIGVTNNGAPYGPKDVSNAIANAAIRAAIDSDQVVPMPEVQEVARNLNAEQHKKELQAVAVAVYGACADTVLAYSDAHAHRLQQAIDLDKIIAGVKP